METSKTRGYGEWGGYVEVVTSPLTSLFVVQSLWLRAREGGPASLGPEAQRETGPWPCGSTGFLGNRPPPPPPPPHSTACSPCRRGGAESARGPACSVMAHLHTRFLPQTDAPEFNPLLCYFTRPASICHTSWKNPQVRDDYQMPELGRLAPFLLPVKQTV